MLRYMGQVFGGEALGPAFGQAFGLIVSIVFALLLLSATNTAIVDLITIQFLMARDRELPKVFQRLNKWGVPAAGMLLATIVPMLLVLAVKDMAGLADLYAVGVVGAIATNLGATCTDWKVKIRRVGTHPDVRHVPRHGRDRSDAADRQTERPLFCFHDSSRRIGFARVGSGTSRAKRERLSHGSNRARSGRIEQSLVLARRMPSAARCKWNPRRAANRCSAPFASQAARWTLRCGKRRRPVGDCIFSSFANSDS